MTVPEQGTTGHHSPLARWIAGGSPDAVVRVMHDSDGEHWYRGDGTPVTAETAQVARRRRPSWVAPILAAIVALMVIMSGAFVWFARHPAKTQAIGPAPVATFSVHGVVWLTVSADVLNVDGAKCEGMGAHGDIKAGVQVKVADTSGTQLAAGPLQQGYMVGQDFFRKCVFAFTVDGVPSGRGSYSVAVANRAPTVVAEDLSHQGVQIELN